MMKQQYDNPLHPRQWRPVTLLIVLAFACAGPASATEVYTWTDEDGVVHFSDSPRASGQMEALEVEEIYRPGSTDVYAQPGDPPTATPAAEGETAALSVAEQRRKDIAKARADRREAQAETDRICARHRQRLEQMEPARRVFYTDANGDSVRMDDDQRMALIDESKAFLRDNCNG